MVALDEAIVKLTELAKERMRDGFGRSLGMKILARALREGRIYPLGSGYFVEYGDIGLLLRSRLTAHYHYVITTVLNLKQKPLRPLSTPRRSPYKSVRILNA